MTEKIKEKIVISNIISLQRQLSLHDWKILRNVFFPDYYEVKHTKGKDSLSWKLIKLHYIREYLKTKQ